MDKLNNILDRVRQEGPDRDSLIEYAITDLTGAVDALYCVVETACGKAIDPEDRKRGYQTIRVMDTEAIMYMASQLLQHVRALRHAYYGEKEGE
jgi:hypothetical protein